MGQEIGRDRFGDADFARFHAALARETAELERWFREGRLRDEGWTGGFELEAWLVDAAGRPAPRNDALIAHLGDPLVVPELARFNIELNGPARPLAPAALDALEADLAGRWRRVAEAARTLGMGAVAVGILPTLRQEDLTLAAMSPLNRYRALNEQIFTLRQGRPVRVDIAGREHLVLEHRDVMLESATTSFQIHLQVPASRAVRYYNASLIASAATVAVSANSPYLFGRDLWDETRIPLFEQSIEVGGYEGAAFGPLRRVSFGTGYARESLMEVFRENLEHFPVLLPVEPEGEPATLPHLRLHNGTIWRWNRPLVGFDADGPHLRIEHRVVPAGPTVADAVANAAFYFGLAHHLATRSPAPEAELPFDRARDNFYRAARDGLATHVHWPGHRVAHPLATLMPELADAAGEALLDLGLGVAEIERCIGIVRERARTGQTGAAWQRAWTAAHGRDMAGLLEAYMCRQAAGEPVHAWDAPAEA